MTSSVRPSLKYSCSGSALRFEKGSTTMEVSGARTVAATDPAGAVSSARSANARSLADWNRAPGCFSRQRAAMRPRSGGRSVPAAETSDTGAERIAASVSVGVGRANARRPVTIS